MKPIKRKKRNPRDIDIRHLDWLEDDVFGDDYQEPRPPPERSSDEDEWFHRRGSDEFDVQRWREDLLRRSAQRKRMRANDMRKGLWDAARN